FIFPYRNNYFSCFNRHRYLRVIVIAPNRKTGSKYPRDHFLRINQKGQTIHFFHLKESLTRKEYFPLVSIRCVIADHIIPFQQYRATVGQNKKLIVTCLVCYFYKPAGILRILLLYYSIPMR